MHSNRCCSVLGQTEPGTATAHLRRAFFTIGCVHGHNHVMMGHDWLCLLTAHARSPTRIRPWLDTVDFNLVTLWGAACPHVCMMCGLMCLPCHSCAALLRCSATLGVYQRLIQQHVLAHVRLNQLTHCLGPGLGGLKKQH